MTTTSIEDRIQRLEDIEAIKKLTATYAHAVDRGWNGRTEVDSRTLSSVFAEDATWTSAAMGVSTKGRDEIVEMLKTAGGVTFAMHSFTNPVIEVEGDTASAVWLLWVGINDGAKANQVYQSENLSYVRTADGWRIQTLHLHFGQMLNS